MVTEVDLAYAAGCIDGEGCIGVYSSGTRSGTSTRLTLQVNNTDFRMIDFFKETFGGLVFSKDYGKRVNYVWRANQKLAGEVLEMVLPYLRVKSEQAVAGITYLTADDLDTQYELMQMLKNLKQEVK